MVYSIRVFLVLDVRTSWYEYRNIVFKVVMVFELIDSRVLIYKFCYIVLDFQNGDRFWF